MNVRAENSSDRKPIQKQPKYIYRQRAKGKRDTLAECLHKTADEITQNRANEPAGPD